MEKTLGGDRLGSGNKQTVELHNYQMNSFNLEQDWKSTMAPGMLYPCLKLIGTNHGTFDIDVDAFIRTLPTKGPLFGAFKFQVDLFSIPIRLYQGILHNNPIGIGLNMNQVYLPKITIMTVDGLGAPRAKGSTDYDYQIHPSSLEKYLGLSGLGIAADAGSKKTTSARKIQCIPELAYYDIFKCYYSNKQEENAYVITPGNPTTVSQKPTEIIVGRYDDDENIISENVYTEFIDRYYNFAPTVGRPGSTINVAKMTFEIKGQDLNINNIEWKINVGGGTTLTKTTEEMETADWLIEAKTTKSSIYFEIDNAAILNDYENYAGGTFTLEDDETLYQSDIKLSAFALKNIDEMRNTILNYAILGDEFNLGIDEEWNQFSGSDNTGLPYSALFNETTEGITWNAFHSNGLVVKTYQSDLFNNWLASEFIDTISNMTKVDTTSGGFTMDTLNLQEKFYELLNRIVVGGGTYEDWQEAVYGEGAVRKAETPMYIGGMSAEVMFEEVISSSETKIDGDYQALGSLGGKGTTVGQHGGRNIHCKCEEPSYIMAIASLTPRICYNQGNDWDRTELETLDDLHKPALDGIGFQDLMTEQMAWWDVVCGASGDTTVIHRSAVGKQTAWINYQTAVDKSYGDFAKNDGYGFMVLNRNYSKGAGTHDVDDITTYIDPTKYNYAFAVDDLYAQNFWCQIHFKITARRKMGAQQLPNL